MDAPKVAALKGQTILFVPFGLIGPFILEQQSLKAALSHAGISMTTCDPNFAPSAAATCMLNAKANGAAAVITSAIPYAVASNAYNSLAAQHTFVLATDAGMSQLLNTSNMVFQSGQSSLNIFGTVAVDYVIAASKGKAHVLFVDQTDSPTIVIEAAVMQAEFKKYCPGCTVVLDTVTATDNFIASSVSSKLVSNPQTDYVLAQTDIQVPVILSGVQSAGFTQKVKCVTLGGAPGALQAAQSNQFVIADVSNDFTYYGWTETDSLLRLLTGAPVGPDPLLPTRAFDQGNLKGANLKSATAGGSSLYGDTSYPQLFLKLWGVQ